MNILKEGKPTIKAYASLKESSMERLAELDNYMDCMLYVCINRTIGILLEIKEFDDIIKENLLKFQAEVENEIDASKLPEDLMNQSSRFENHPAEFKNTLRQWHLEHSHNPYPTQDEVSHLSEKTGFPLNQCATGFTT